MKEYRCQLAFQEDLYQVETLKQSFSQTAFINSNTLKVHYEWDNTNFY